MQSLSYRELQRKCKELREKGANPPRLISKRSVLLSWLERRNRLVNVDLSGKGVFCTAYQGILDNGCAVAVNVDLQNILGKGGFCTVYRGILGNGYTVAVKRISPIKNLELFLREAAVTKTLDHPNILKLLGVHKTPDNIELLYPLYQGSLQNSPFCITDRKEVYHVIREICKGLQYLHSNNIVHGDLKPSNVLFGNNGEVVLADLGGAVLGASRRTGAIVNHYTYSYAPPEYLLGAETNTCACYDVWSLGVLLYNWITGKCLTSTKKGTTPNEKRVQVLEGILGSLGGIIHPPWDRCISKRGMVGPFNTFSEPGTITARRKRVENLVRSKSFEGLGRLLNFLLSWIPNERPTVDFLLRSLGEDPDNAGILMLEVTIPEYDPANLMEVDSWVKCPVEKYLRRRWERGCALDILWSAYIYYTRTVKQRTGQKLELIRHCVYLAWVIRYPTRKIKSRYCALEDSLYLEKLLIKLDFQIELSTPYDHLSPEDVQNKNIHLALLGILFNKAVRESHTDQEIALLANQCD